MKIAYEGWGGHMRPAMLLSAATVAFVSEHPETVRIKRNGDTVTINLSDYDKDRDGDPVDGPGLAMAPADNVVVPPAPSAPGFIDAVAPLTVNEDTLTVTKKGKKFIVVYAKDAEPVTDWRDIDEKGYNTDGEAWAAIMAAKRQPHEQTETPHTPTFPNAEQIEDAAK